VSKLARIVLTLYKEKAWQSIREPGVWLPHGVKQWDNVLQDPRCRVGEPVLDVHMFRMHFYDVHKSFDAWDEGRGYLQMHLESVDEKIRNVGMSIPCVRACHGVFVSFSRRLIHFKYRQSSFRITEQDFLSLTFQEKGRHMDWFIRIRNFRWTGLGVKQYHDRVPTAWPHHCIKLEAVMELSDVAGGNCNKFLKRAGERDQHIIELTPFIEMGLSVIPFIQVLLIFAPNFLLLPLSSAKDADDSGQLLMTFNYDVWWLTVWSLSSPFFAVIAGECCARVGRFCRYMDTAVDVYLERDYTWEQHCSLPVSEMLKERMDSYDKENHVIIRQRNGSKDDWKVMLVVQDKHGNDIDLQWNGEEVSVDFAAMKHVFPLTVVRKQMRALVPSKYLGTDKQKAYVRDSQKEEGRQCRAAATLWWLYLLMGLLSVASVALWSATMINVGVTFTLSFKASFVLTFRYDLTFWCGLLNLLLTYSTLLESIKLVFGFCTSAKHGDPLPNARSASPIVPTEVQSPRKTVASLADARADIDALDPLPNASSASPMLPSLLQSPRNTGPSQADATADIVALNGRTSPKAPSPSFGLVAPYTFGRVGATGLIQSGDDLVLQLSATTAVRVAAICKQKQQKDAPIPSLAVQQTATAERSCSIHGCSTNQHEEICSRSRCALQGGFFNQSC
jgi:hypothetical protein